ncbi:GDP-mannose 4,6-dehydratase [Marihabitans asiaticum]|uniref:Nucleoside-diphosphate-sugar epimerase n=1 Tax=Marihabitans asiaticum TaxID=415218 RepID=A0A560WDX8_9MICO|nr:NAD(P)-dependent oxidoreductase [Marihabitans asiaticum]TWD15832.1 nucleoside-diphosphate-sugar epimerase [Marihabitans asiaticum]
MRVTVTGGEGFIGRTVVPHLVGLGHEVTVLDRAAREERRDGVVRIRCELTEIDGEAFDALTRADAVIHLAGCPGVRDDGPQVRWRRRRDNVEATRAVTSTVPATTPLLAFSSSSVYGGAQVQGRRIRPSAEADQLRPRGGYARSKVDAERVCRERAAAGGHVLVVRPFTVVGEHQRADMAVALWSRQLRRGEPVVLLGGADRTRDITDVRDVARAVTGLLDRGASGTVNLGTGVSHTLVDLARSVAAATGCSGERVVADAERREVSHTMADISLLRSILGWFPTTDLDAVVRRAVHALGPVRAAEPAPSLAVTA